MPRMQLGAGFAEALRHRKDRRDVVAGMAVIGGEEGVVHVELAHRGAVGPGRPFRADAGAVGQAEDRGALRGSGECGCASAMSRADMQGWRLTLAIATAALSMTRLTIISSVSGGTATLSAATAAIFQASCSSRGKWALDGWTVTSCICMLAALPWRFCLPLIRLRSRFGKDAPISDHPVRSRVSW